MVDSSNLGRLVMRDFRLSDFEDVLRVENESFDEPYRYGRKDFEEFLSLNPVFKVALFSGSIVGYVLGVIRDSTCLIDSVAVEPRYRGLGIGTSLMLCAMSECRARGARKVFLEVSVHNKLAIGLFTKLGFRVSRLVWKDPTEGWVYIMERDLL